MSSWAHRESRQRRPTGRPTGPESARKPGKHGQTGSWRPLLRQLPRSVCRISHPATPRERCYEARRGASHETRPCPLIYLRFTKSQIQPTPKTTAPLQDLRGGSPDPPRKKRAWEPPECVLRGRSGDPPRETCPTGAVMLRPMAKTVLRIAQPPCLAHAARCAASSRRQEPGRLQDRARVRPDGRTRACML
jgi:hypothetical protein